MRTCGSLMCHLLSRSLLCKYNPRVTWTSMSFTYSFNFRSSVSRSRLFIFLIWMPWSCIRKKRKMKWESHKGITLLSHAADVNLTAVTRGMKVISVVRSRLSFVLVEQHDPWRRGSLSFHAGMWCTNTLWMTCSYQTVTAGSQCPSEFNRWHLTRGVHVDACMLNGSLTAFHWMCLQNYIPFESTSLWLWIDKWN